MRKVWGKQNKGAALSLALIIVQAAEKIVSTRQQKSPGKRKQTKSIAKNIYALFALEWIKQSVPNQSQMYPKTWSKSNDDLYSWDRLFRLHHSCGFGGLSFTNQLREKHCIMFYTFINQFVQV